MKTLLRPMLLALCVTACQPLASENTHDATDTAKKLTFVVINDTYRLDNFPYVRSLRSELEKQYGDVVLLHAGDFLYPSLLSQRFDGAQMIDVFNRLDGDGEGFDERFFVTFGNHEFEKDRMKHLPQLRQRIEDSDFVWLGTNIRFKGAPEVGSMVSVSNLANARLIDVNGIPVGFASATTAIKPAEYIGEFVSPELALRTEIRHLRQQGARYVVAVTHQTVAEDLALIKALGSDAPDLVAGGHEHDRQKFEVAGRLLVKADADANSAAIVHVDFKDDEPNARVEYVDLPGRYAADPMVQRQVDDWSQRFESEHCRAQGAAEDCMRVAIGKTRVDLVAEELTIRRYETNLGNFLADTALDAFRASGAQVAFLNSGGMRLNYNIPAGDITRKHVDSLFAFPTRLSVIRINGQQLQRIVDHAITDWTGHGRWLQISGFAFHHDSVKGKATGLSLVTAQGLKPIKPDDVILAVTNDYLLNRKGDQDGFTMIGDEMVISPPSAAVDLKALTLQRITAAGEKGIAPVVDGRICNSSRQTACLVKQ